LNSAETVDNLVLNWKRMGMTRAEIVVKEAEAMLGWSYVWGATGQDCTPEKRTYFMNRSAIGPKDAELIMKRCQVLNGSCALCGGCKFYPNGARTRIQDCHGFVKELHKAVGITLKGGGCTSMWNDNSNWAVKGPISEMPPGQVCCVFKHIASTGKMDHMGEHIGAGNIIHCSGEVKRGKTSEKGWTHYAIPKGMEDDEQMPVWRSTIRKGSTGDDVRYCQEILNNLGYDTGGIDGKFGEKTRKAVMAFQQTHDLGVDGVVGPMTWEKLEAANDGSTEQPTLYMITIRNLSLDQANALKEQYPDSNITEYKG